MNLIRIGKRCFVQGVEQLQRPVFVRFIAEQMPEQAVLAGAFCFHKIFVFHNSKPSRMNFILCNTLSCPLRISPKKGNISGKAAAHCRHSAVSNSRHSVSDLRTLLNHQSSTCN
jgi:hypothetical protein